MDKINGVITVEFPDENEIFVMTDRSGCNLCFWRWATALQKCSVGNA